MLASKHLYSPQMRNSLLSLLMMPVENPLNLSALKEQHMLANRQNHVTVRKAYVVATNQHSQTSLIAIQSCQRSYRQMLLHRRTLFYLFSHVYMQTDPIKQKKARDTNLLLTHEEIVFHEHKLLKQHLQHMERL